MDIKNLAELSERQAALRPDDTALVYGRRTTSYAELGEITNRIANGLTAADVPRQSRIGYLGKNSDLYFALALGCAKSANVVTAINFRLAEPEIVYIAGDAELRVLFVTSEYFEIAARLETELPGLGLIVTLDGRHSRWPVIEDWLAAQSATPLAAVVREEDDFNQLYTSGTTGHPKGVQLSQPAWIQFANAMTASSWASYQPGEVVLGAMPVFHVAGSNTGLLAILQGCKLVVLDEIVPADLLKAIEVHRINHAFLVPAVILMLTQQPGVRDHDFSSLRIMSYGASPIAESVLLEAQDIFGCGFVQLYGLTENNGGATFLSPEDHNPERGKLRSCGRPYQNSEVRIVSDDGRTLPTGEVGEICLRSSWLMRGYWHKPEATAEAVRDGWFHTGDAGFLDEDGYLYIHDRIKDMIISGGENVYPAEVENALFAHDAVADVAVVSVPDDRWGEAVKAVVVLKPDHDIDEADLIGFARDRIAAFKVPKTVDFVDALPRNASGKVLRRELREKYWSGRERRVS